jgi:hypothetical protein
MHVTKPAMKATTGVKTVRSVPCATWLDKTFTNGMAVNALHAERLAMKIMIGVGTAKCVLRAEKSEMKVMTGFWSSKALSKEIKCGLKEANLRNCPCFMNLASMTAASA